MSYRVVRTAVQVEEKEKPNDNSERYKKSLRIWNGVVAGVQFASFTAILIISLVDLDNARRVALWIDSATGVQSLGSYPLFATLVPFPFITGVFHLLALFNVDDYYNGVLFRGINRLRWIEYSITNSLITFSLCVLAGAGGVVLLTVNVLANATMQYFGYLHEKKIHPPNSTERTLWYIAIGFLPWLQTWVTVLTYYGLNFSAATLSDGFAIIGSLFWSLSFVFPLLWRYSKPASLKNNYTMELMYIFLSLTAKIWLDWTVVIGTLVDN